MTDDQTPTGALTVQGPRHTFASELRSVANSIEPLFPDAADLLRGIARHNEESGAALAEAEQKGAREALTAAANVFDSELAMQREHALPYNLIGVGAWLRDRAAQIGGDS